MNNIIPWEMNKQYKDKFIQGYYIDTDLCDRFIEYYQNEGSDNTTYMPSPRNYTHRDLASFDQHHHSVVSKYINLVYQCFIQYKHTYPLTHTYFDYIQMSQRVNFQHFKPNQSYEIYHTENESTFQNLKIFRHSTFITYLNDCEDGWTEFPYQNINVIPKKGLTICWPAGWNFVHKGTPCSIDKYIMTGWMIASPMELRETFDLLGDVEKERKHDISLLDYR